MVEGEVHLSGLALPLRMISDDVPGFRLVRLLFVAAVVTFDKSVPLSPSFEMLVECCYESLSLYGDVKKSVDA